MSLTAWTLRQLFLLFLILRSTVVGGTPSHFLAKPYKNIAFHSFASRPAFYPTPTAVGKPCAAPFPSAEAKVCMSVLVGRNRSFHLTAMSLARKAGVASPEELKAFVAEAGSRLLVVDVRNPDSSAEPGDQKSLAVAGLPSEGYRPQACHLVYDRSSGSMPVPDVEKDTPIITHCGGGGRGQKAKEYLESKGYTNVLNGGGPKEKECWDEFGDK